MKKITILFALFLAFTLSVNNYAQTKTKHLNKRQITQQKRIHQGIKSGQLTKHEVKKLERQSAKLQLDKSRAKADGVVTKKERIKLNKKADRISRNIYKEKHDRQRRR